MRTAAVAIMLIVISAGAAVINGVAFGFVVINKLTYRNSKY